MRYTCPGKPIQLRLRSGNARQYSSDWRRKDRWAPGILTSKAKYQAPIEAGNLV
jgi:hypothetical protein